MTVSLAGMFCVRVGREYDGTKGAAAWMKRRSKRSKRKGWNRSYEGSNENSKKDDTGRGL
jgi:hypothetical protein